MNVLRLSEVIIAPQAWLELALCFSSTPLSESHYVTELDLMSHVTDKCCGGVLSVTQANLRLT